MAILVIDPDLEQRLKSQREESGADRYDEVWEGVYIISPLADDEHQDLQTGLAAAFKIAVGWSGMGQVRAGVNVSDREGDWTENYRIPDVAVFLPGNAARNRGTFWLGGPDFAVEIISRHDRTREKLPFYAQVGTREVLLVDRYPWALELYQLRGNTLERVSRTTPESTDEVRSTVLPLSFRLLPGTPRPIIQVSHRDGGQQWAV